MARVPPGFLFRPAAARFLAGFACASLELVVKARRVDGHPLVNEGVAVWLTKQPEEQNTSQIYRYKCDIR